MVFVEQDVDHSPGDRQDRWWAAYTGSSPYLPLVMVDSGHRISTGSVDFYNVYKGMVDAELTREPGADFESVSTSVGERLRLSGWMTNRSGTILSTARNDATIHGDSCDPGCNRQGPALMETDCGGAGPGHPAGAKIGQMRPARGEPCR